MPDDRSITFGEAVKIITDERGGSVGHAEALVRRALQSGEVRPDWRSILLTADDGVVGMHLRSGATRFSRSDFVDWLDRSVPAALKQTAAPSGNKRTRATEAIASLWTNGVPSQALLPNDLLCTQVIDWLKSDCAARDLPFANIGKDTILRAAGRK